MKLTPQQNEWLLRKQIKVGESYMFPRWGFNLYTEPRYGYGTYIDTNPYTKSLDSEMFLVKEKVNGFCRGNFERKPKYPDMYIPENELCRRDFIEVMWLYIFTWLPMAIYNLFITHKSNG